PTGHRAAPPGSAGSGRGPYPESPGRPACRTGASIPPAARRRFRRPAGPCSRRGAGLPATRAVALCSLRTPPRRAARTNPRRWRPRCGRRPDAGKPYPRLQCATPAPPVRGRRAATWWERFPKPAASLSDGALVLAVPVRPAEGQEPIGVVEALLSLKFIKAKLDEEGRGGVLAYVVDRSGSLILSSDASAFRSKDVHQLDLVSEFIAHPVRITKSYMRGEGKTARRVLGTLATIATPDWGVIVEKDEAAAYASVAQMKRESSKIAVFSLLFAGLVALLAARLLAHPLVELVEKVRSIAEGSFKQRVEVRGVRELAELSETFNSMSDSIEKSVAKLKLAAKENQELFINSVRTLAAAIDAKDPYTRGHSERVARYAVVLARHMDLSPEEVRVVRLSALLHDVGKIGIDDRILRKPTALTSEEFEIMKTHPAKGALIMGQIPQLKNVIPGIKHH